MPKERCPPCDSSPEAPTARAEARVTDIVPTIGEPQAAGATSLRGIAAAFNDRGIPTATDVGEWQSLQVRRVLARM